MDGPSAKGTSFAAQPGEVPRVAHVPPAEAVWHYHNLFLGQPAEFARVYVSSSDFREAVHSCGLALVQQQGFAPTLVRIPQGAIGAPVATPGASDAEHGLDTGETAYHLQKRSSPNPLIAQQFENRFVPSAAPHDAAQPRSRPPDLTCPTPGSARASSVQTAVAPVSDAPLALGDRERPGQNSSSPLAPSVQRLFDAVPRQTVTTVEVQGGDELAMGRGGVVEGASDHFHRRNASFGSEMHTSTEPSSEMFGVSGNAPRTGVPGGVHAVPSLLRGSQSISPVAGTFASCSPCNEPGTGAAAAEQFNAHLGIPQTHIKPSIDEQVPGYSTDAFDEFQRRRGPESRSVPERRGDPNIVETSRDLLDLGVLGSVLPPASVNLGPSPTASIPLPVGGGGHSVIVPASGTGTRYENIRHAQRGHSRPPTLGGHAPLAPKPVRVTPRTKESLPEAPPSVTAPAHVCELLNRQAWELYDQIRPEDSEAERRARLLAHMNKVVRSEWPDSCVRMFGSGASGLNLRGGDVDMCLMVPPQPQKPRLRRPRRGGGRGSSASGSGSTRRGVDTGGVPGSLMTDKQIMRVMVAILRRSKMTITQELLGARVPIIKVSDPVSGFQLDVCLNNELGHHNTNLLRTYTNLDPRVHPLCLLIKFWAKRRAINNAYRGTLSSYAYVLLVFQYLQMRPNPILPCLQQMYKGKTVSDPLQLPEKIVASKDGVACNTYFDSSMARFGSDNHESLGELLIGFFHFCAYEFDFTQDVACVRLGRVISRKIKSWDTLSVQMELDRVAKEAEAEAEAESDAKVARVIKPPVRSEPAFPLGDNTSDQAPENVGVLDEENFPSLRSSSTAPPVSPPKAIPTPPEGSPPGMTNLASRWAQRTGSELLGSAGRADAPHEPQSDEEADGALREITRMELVQRRLRKIPRHVFCIEDPFDLTHDLGRNLDSETLNVVRHEFVRAHSILVSSGDLHRMLAKYSG